MRPVARALLMSALAGCAGNIGATEVRQFKDPVEQQRYEHLIEDLRCLVCQNQSLADSDADLAQDLRDEVYQIIQSGKSDDEAVKFLVDRYGDFVLYRPPVNTTTILLWSGPFLLLGSGLLFIWYRTRARRHDSPVSLTVAERERLESLEKDIRG